MSGTSGPVDFVFNSRCLLSAASEPHRRSFLFQLINENILGLIMFMYSDSVHCKSVSCVLRLQYIISVDRCGTDIIGDETCTLVWTTENFDRCVKEMVRCCYLI